MKVSRKTYIIIKGIEWLYNRLDEIGYHQSYIDLARDIWGHKRVSRELLKEIVGDMK